MGSSTMLRGSATVVAVFVVTCVTAISAYQTNHSQSEVATAEEGRGHKTDKMMKDMYMAFMLAKNMIGFILMFVSPIIQIKGFGLSVINTLINIGRLILQMQSTKQMKLLYSPHVHHVSTGPAADHEWSFPQPYAYYAPPPHKAWGSAREGQLAPLSGSYEERVYPFFQPNVTAFR